jgi:DNA-binding NarL/FixJ family response regulator
VVRKAVCRHYFVSTRTDPLPRWLEAFPDARVSAGIPRLPAKNVLVWLEIRPGSTVEHDIRQFRERLGNRPFVVLNGLPTDDEALLSFSLGAKAYCNAHSSPANLKVVAEVVRQGGLWLGNSLLQRLIDATTRPALANISSLGTGETNVISTLSARERQVAQAIAAGAQNKEVARQLGITERTVKAHVGAIFDKLQIRDRLQLAILLNRNKSA